MIFWICLYATAAYYYVWRNLERVSKGALLRLSLVPAVQNNKLFKNVQTKITEVVLPNHALQALSALAVSLFAYPAVRIASSVTESLINVLALFALAYLSLSQSAQSLEFVSKQFTAFIDALRNNAPEQFEQLLNAQPQAEEKPSLANTSEIEIPGTQ